MPIDINTGVLIEERSVVWTINNFDSVRKSNELIASQKYVFHAGGSIGLPVGIELGLDLTKNRGRRDDWIGAFFFLENKPANVAEVNISYSMRIKRADGSVYCNRTQELANLGVNVPGYCLGEALIYRKLRFDRLPLVNGSLIIEVDFKLYAVDKKQGLHVDVASKQKEFQLKSLEQLSTDLAKTEALTGPNSDSVTKIISADKVEFPVNRGLLAARSSVFRQLFQTDMIEASTGIVQIDDISSKAMDVLLHYISSGTLLASWRSSEVILELTYAAIKYNLELLTEFLNDTLGEVCTIENAAELALIANKSGMEKAERALVQYIKDNAVGICELVIVSDEPPTKKLKTG